MKKYYLLLKVLLIVGTTGLIACGKKGPLEYPEESSFPHDYPKPE